VHGIGDHNREITVDAFSVCACNSERSATAPGKSDVANFSHSHYI
jgi:hypothetical protein